MPIPPKNRTATTRAEAPGRYDVAPPLGDVVGYTDFEFDLLSNTRPANVTRMPAITLPAGTTDGLPVGFQLMGREFEDARLWGVAASVEPHLPR